MMAIYKGKCMKIWLDDIRPAPKGYVWCKSVNIAKRTIESAEEQIVLIDCDHDLGDYACDGGDGIKLLGKAALSNKLGEIKCNRNHSITRNNIILQVQ
jgi:hypothetical protein